MSRHETTGRNVAMIGNTAKNEGRRYWRKGRHSPSTGGLTKNKSENFFPPPCFRSRLFLPLQGHRRGLVIIKLETFLFPLASAPGPCYLFM